VDYGTLSDLLSRILEVSEDSGAVSSGTTTSLTDTTKGWATDDWKGAKVHILHKGIEYVRTITGNTADTLTFSPVLSEAPSAGDSYMIRRAVAPFDMQDRVARVLGQLTDGTSAIVPAKTNQLPSSLTASGNLKVGIVEDTVDLAKSSDLSPLSEIGTLTSLSYTTTPLGASGSWTSDVDSSLNTGRIVGTVLADQSGTLYVEQSPDNTNWDVVDSFSVSAGSGIGFSVEKVAQYTRVRYVNGATAQTAFRLYVWRRLRVR
jgi:hypothetical protein